SGGRSGRQRFAHIQGYHRARLCRFDDGEARKRCCYQRLETDRRRRALAHRRDECVDFSGVALVLRASADLELLPVSDKLAAPEIAYGRYAATAEDLDLFFRNRLVAARRINYRC